MKKLIRRTLRVLDGTPKFKDGKPQRGQSVVELALVTPLLIILLVGLTEIGWFARNYLTLMEVSRVGARRGATLQEEFSPLQWQEVASLPNPGEQFDPDWGLLSDDDKDYRENYRRNVRTCPPPPSAEGQPSQIGFYNLILCQMLQSLDPLTLDLDNDIDDIAISVFSILVIENGPTGDIDLTTTNTVRDGEFDRTGHIPVVAGRWPTNANECNVWLDPINGTGVTYDRNGLAVTSLIYERDPFDFIDQTQIDSATNTFVSSTIIPAPVGSTDPDYILPLELADGNPTAGWETVGYDDYITGEAEVVRGFVATGQQRIDDVTRNIDVGAGDVEMQLLCWGSDKDVYWMQEQLLGGDFILSTDEIQAVRAIAGQENYCVPEAGTGYCDQREFLPNNGLVLVEVWWQHQLLLDIPVFSPVYQILDDDQTTIHVWSAFPTPAVIPQLQYDLTQDDVFED
jgi:hypothetical protein